MIKENYQGLNEEEVIESRKLHGENVLKELGRRSWDILWEILKDPMLIILIVASCIYFLTDTIKEGVIMLVAIALVTGISIYQQIRSENAIKLLRKLTQSLVISIRNGKHVSIPSEKLVVKDVIIISEGQEIPADAVILDQNDLSVDESILTGESFPVQKNETNKQLFAGTTVVSGMAHAGVIAVGNATRIGKLGITMEGIRKEKTPLQQQISTFVKRMAVFGIFAFILVSFYNFLESGNLLHGIMHGLALAMAVLPEEIPVALSTFMALGAYQMSKKKVLVKHPQTVEALGAATVICIDKTGTITENKMSVAELFDYKLGRVIDISDNDLQASSQKLVLNALLASEVLPFDPMEKAIHELAKRFNFKNEKYKMIKEYPLSGIPPIMTHIYTYEDSRRIIVCKGAPEGVLKNSNLSEEEKLSVLEMARKIASKGHRVLGVAESVYDREELPASQDTFQWNFSGLIALSDPPKKNIANVIKSFYKAGISVKMITGDFPETAIRIAEMIGIKNPGNVVTGKEVMEMSEEELLRIVPQTNIYARVMPETKLQIIHALKKMDEVVAMTGDGVNDGPALKASHIGIAMGIRGSEVARQAASLILLNDDLSGMVTAVGFGRKIYANLKMAIQYIISIHIPLISIVTLPLLLGWKFPNIFTPVHIIFLELVMGPTCSIVYENEPMDNKLLTQKPRKLINTFFTWNELSISVIQGVVITVGLMIILFYSIKSMMDENSARTMVFTTLVLSNVFLTLTGRSRTKSIVSTIRNKNNLMPAVILLTLAMLFLSVYFRPVQAVFDFTSLSNANILICLSTAVLSVLWIELFKLRKA
jgi:Ca2+-transporting ATPase